jgi:hypothetical protein
MKLVPPKSELPIKQFTINTWFIIKIWDQMEIKLSLKEWELKMFHEVSCKVPHK